MVAVAKRRYDSSRRRSKAKESQSAIVHAARDLFVEQGYVRTTIADVARAAGVSVETIFGMFGNKATLLHRAWDITIGGDDQDLVLRERPEIVAIATEPDLAKRLMLLAKFVTTTAQRIAPFVLMVQSAAGADPTATAMLNEIARQRLVGAGVMAANAGDTGQLVMSEQECRDIIWSFTDGVLWHRLVCERGWSNARFAEWLGNNWCREFVGIAAVR